MADEKSPVRISHRHFAVKSLRNGDSMEAYSSFAKVYDMFMDNVPYEEWGKYLINLLEEYGIKDGLVLDLGCGTGSITEILADKGYDMIGIDYSEEMLNVALDKKEKSGNNILYLNQDMREFELYGTVRAIVSICDSMNYMTTEEDLRDVFKLVNNYLDIGGIFIFDLNTIHKYETIGEQVIAENRDEGSFIWENTFYEDEGAVRLYPRFGVYGTPKIFDSIDDFDIHGFFHEYKE